MNAMKHFKLKEILEQETIYKANFINSITGYKPGNLIGTKSEDGITNLAIFSSIVHLGANPPLLGFVLRPAQEVPRNTYENIKSTGYFTVNHIHESFIEKAHFTSAKFDSLISEFDTCQLTEEYIDDFLPPFVKESQIKMGLKFEDEFLIPQNNCTFIIGSMQHIILPEETISENGSINLNLAESIAISGLDTYHKVHKIESFSFARPTNLPIFK